MTRFYGVDAFNVSKAVLSAMEANADKIKALERLESGTVPDAEIYDLVLRATGDKNTASKALAARIRYRQERGEKTNVYR
jgi:hypothetical protein